MATKAKVKKTDESEYDVLERVTRRINEEGLEAAFDALLDVCRDGKAQPTARSSAATSIFRAGGLFDPNRGEGSGKAPSEMSPEEIARALDKLRRQLADSGTRTDEDIPDDGSEDEGSDADSKDEEPGDDEVGEEGALFD